MLQEREPGQPVSGSIAMKIYSDRSKSSVFKHKLEIFFLNMSFPVRKTILWIALLEKKMCILVSLTDSSFLWETEKHAQQLSTVLFILKSIQR